MVHESITSGPKHLVILCFVAYYLPGYRSGGPVRTIANFVDHLGDEFDIRIVTRDRDALDSRPYEGVAIDGWNRVGKASVFYASSKTLTLSGIAKLLCNTPHDILYLNSFFAFKFTTLPLLARRLGLAPRKPSVIAPRGEFSAGALALKAQKKWLYLKVASSINLYSRLVWQASSEFERADIRREVGSVASAIHDAPDLPPKVHVSNRDDSLTALQGDDTALQIIFLSRITPMKNLDFLLEALCSVQAAVSLAIYGPIREPDYWQKCQALMASLPANIFAKYNGEVHPSLVLETFSAFDIFVLPTRGENYGHVVLESLMAGTPVLISDQTPWQSWADGGVEVMPLRDPSQWASYIDRVAMMSRKERFGLRTAASNYARRYLNSSNAVDQNRTLFMRALQTSFFSIDAR